EAAAVGLPVVSTRVGGVEELLADGSAGFLVESTPAAFGAALATLANDGPLRGRLGAEGREYVATLSWKRSIDGTSELYDALLGRAKAAGEPVEALAEVGAL